jgi:phosphate transport system permease protein
MSSATLEAPALKPPGPISRAGKEGTSAWPLADRVGFWLSWATGIALCLIAFAIVLFMLVKGLAYLRPSLLFHSPAASALQNQSGGFLDPIEGTLMVTAIGIAIAGPLGIGLAVWLSEYGRPTWLARVLESGMETLSGIPSVVLAIFGLLIFAEPFLGFLSQTDSNGAVYGRSFFAAGAVMAALALPLVVGSTREALAQLPNRLREASFALGKTPATTIRHVLLPAIRPGIASGLVLGMGRIIGDTAIIRILAGVSLTIEGVGHTPVLSTLRGTGSTLTTYVYENSPAGEGSAPQKAYAAAFVLLLIVLVLNAIVTRLTSASERPARRSRRLYQLIRFQGIDD